MIGVHHPQRKGMGRFGGAAQSHRRRSEDFRFGIGAPPVQEDGGRPSRRDPQSHEHVDGADSVHQLCGVCQRDSEISVSQH